MTIEAFEPNPPTWTKTAVHAIQFYCPKCRASAAEAQKVWLNRRSPVLCQDGRRKWQEFYQCQCDQVWWAWSSDRPTTDFTNRES